MSKIIIDFCILNERNQLYIQKRVKNRKIYPNVWELPGGTLEKDEKIEECIARELKEELNLDLSKIGNLIYKTNFIYKNENYIYQVFEIFVKNWQNFKLEENKADEFKFISQDEIDVLNINRKKKNLNPIYLAVKKFFER